jgi:hypothetical protein
VALKGVDQGRTVLGGPLPSFFVSADSKEDSGDEAVPEKITEKTFDLKDVTPGVLRKSAERVDGKGFRQTLFFEECGRV